MEHRERARELAAEYVADGRPTEWFDVLYAEGLGGEAEIPWAEFEPNPNLVAWLDRSTAAAEGGRALKVGCGLGDDAEALSERGFDVTAFDVSPTAIDWCRERFPDSTVEYLVADLLDAPDEWARAFDLVVESYTLQVLPAPERRRAVPAVADLVAPGGTLLVICRGRDPDEPTGELPWPLTRETVLRFADEGLELVGFEDYEDDETPPVRRFRAEFERPKR
jgi:SAM-dependent methyltransferase